MQLKKILKKVSECPEINCQTIIVCNLMSDMVKGCPKKSSFPMP